MLQEITGVYDLLATGRQLILAMYRKRAFRMLGKKMKGGIFIDDPVLTSRNSTIEEWRKPSRRASTNLAECTREHEKPFRVKN